MTHCVAGFCVTDQALHGPCVGQFCASDLRCDDVLWTCEEPTSTLEVGAVCTGDALGCAPRLVCRGARSNQDGGAGLTGTCDPRQVGESCSSSAQCPTSSTCSGGVCAFTRAGAPCLSDDNCPVGDFCSKGACASYVALGEACDAGTRCAASAVCADLPSEVGTFRCRALVGAGAACGTRVGEARVSPSSMMTDGQCRLPLACVAGACVHRGGAGESCFGGPLCFSGACRGPDGGLGWVSDGTCGAMAASGGTCFGAEGCEPGTWCDAVTHTCVPSCH